MTARRMLDLWPGDDALLSHFAGADATGAGFGDKPWERRHVRLMNRSWDMNTLTMRDKYLDTRKYLVALWDPGISHEAPSIDRRGYALLAQGARRTLTRNSPAWCENPAVARTGSVQIVALIPHQDKHSTLGTLLEAARTNLLIQSAFKNGTFTGWTVAGTGSNGSAITAETTDILFESAAAAQVARFLAGTPIHASDLQLTSTATASITANSKTRVSVYRKDLNGSPFFVAIQRGFDSNWWRESDSTWQASKTWNVMPSASAWARWISKSIDVGTSATTLTAVVGIPNSGGVAGQINLCGHVQIEVGEYATSPIVTEAASVTRAVDSLTYENWHGRRVLPSEFYTARISIRSLWSTSELPSGAVRTILDSTVDVDNYDRLWYDQATAALIYRRRRKGTNHSATLAYTFTAGQLVRLGIRAASSRGEWGLSPYTLSVFAEGTKGTDAVAAGVLCQGSKDTLRVLHRDATPTDVFDGYFQDLEIRKLVLPDQEMLA